jgi:hypothetical protein
MVTLPGRLAGGRVEDLRILHETERDTALAALLQADHLIRQKLAALVEELRIIRQLGRRRLKSQEAITCLDSEKRAEDTLISSICNYNGY